MNKKVKQIIQKNKYRSKFYHLHKKSSKPKTHSNSENKDGKNKLYASFLNKLLVSVCVLLILLICKDNDKINFIYQETFRSMNFVSIKSYVNQNLNGIFPKTEDPNKYVGAIVIDMNNTTIYREGVMIETDYSAPVESSVSGIIIRIYKDNELGKVLVIQDILGREYHYGYFETIEVGLYSSVYYGDILGLGRMTEDMNGQYYLAIKDGDNYLDVLDVVSHEN